MGFQNVTYRFPLDFPNDSRTGILHFCQGHSKKQVSLPASLERDFVGLIFNLKTTLSYQLKGRQKGSLPRLHYCLVHVPKGDFELTVGKGEHEVACIELTPSYLVRARDAFPILNAFLNSAAHNSEAYLSKHFPITPPILNELCPLPWEDDGNVITKAIQGCKYSSIAMNSLYNMETFIKIGKEDLERIRQARDYVVSNLRYPINVPLLADMTNQTKHNFQNYFKMLFGSTVYHFLTNERMNRAIALLRDTNMSLSEIATSVGYSKLNNFYKTFKRWFGHSPGELRKKKDE